MRRRDEIEIGSLIISLSIVGALWALDGPLRFKVDHSLATPVVKYVFDAYRDNELHTGVTLDWQFRGYHDLEAYLAPAGVSIREGDVLANVSEYQFRNQRNGVAITLVPAYDSH